MKATALTQGLRTSVSPTRWLAPCSSEKMPGSMSVSRIAFTTALATISDVPGWPGCALTTTGHPAANADDRSLPATEIASGKVAGGERRDGPDRDEHPAKVRPGQRLAVGQGAVDPGLTHEPSSTTRANMRSWLHVPARSPVRRWGPGRLQVSPLDQGFAQGLDLGRDPVEQRRPLFGGPGAEIVERRRRESRRRWISQSIASW